MTDLLGRGLAIALPIVVCVILSGCGSKQPAHTPHIPTASLSIEDAKRVIYRSLETQTHPYGACSPSGEVGHWGDEAAALEYGRKAFAIYPFDWPALVLLRDYALRAGRYTEVRALYEKTHPDLLNADAPEIGDSNYWAAINLALALSKTDEQKRADLLLDRSFEFIQTLPQLGHGGHGFADVQIYALQGEKQKALSALRQAIDEGWRFLWWYLLKHDPTLESLHDEPEYQAMVEEIEADMAAQLARVREMERNGELEPIPKTVAE